MAKWKWFVVALVTALAGMSGAVAHAQSNFQSGNTVTVPISQTVDQTFYAAGQTIDIAGTINGDVFCVGQTITVSGTVNGDVICAGQTVTVTGKVTGDVRLAGQAVTVGAQVGGGMSAIGQSVTLQSGALIGRDASIGAQQFTLDGRVNRDAAIGGTNVAINGAIGRDAVVSDTTLALGGRAVIGGDLTYYSRQELSKANGAQVAGVTTRKQPQEYQRPTRSPFSGWGFLFYLLCALLLIALVLSLLLPRFLQASSEAAIRSPFKTAAIGLAVSIGVPIVIFVLFITVLGIPLALLLLLAWIVVSAVAWVFAAYYLGRLILGRRTNNVIWYALLGAAVVVILSFVPFLGFFVWLVASWLGLGMLASQMMRLPRPRYQATPSEQRPAAE